MQRLLLAVLASSLIVPTASAQVRVNGYVKKDGTYVAPHYRSAPNNTTSDNYSTKGNYNPYTGKVGTKEPSTTKPFGSSYGGFGTSTTKPKSSSCTFLCSDDE